MLCINFCFGICDWKFEFFFSRQFMIRYFIHTDGRIENDAANIFTIGLHAYFITRGYYQSSIYIIFAFIELGSYVEFLLIFRQYLNFFLFCPCSASESSGGHFYSQRLICIRMCTEIRICIRIWKWNGIWKQTSNLNQFLKKWT